MMGKRLSDGHHDTFSPGDYWLDENGTWMASTPTGALGNLKRHEVVVNADGSISVTPSILVDDGHQKWHGYLTDGVWRQV